MGQIRVDLRSVLHMLVMDHKGEKLGMGEIMVGEKRGMSHMMLGINSFFVWIRSGMSNWSTGSVLYEIGMCHIELLLAYG
jgi:hypothetical protein